MEHPLSLEPVVDTNAFVSALPRSEQRITSVLLACARAYKRVSAAEIMNLFEGAAGLLKTLKADEHMELRAKILHASSGLEMRAALLMPVETASSVLYWVEQSDQKEEERAVRAERILGFLSADELVSRTEPKLVWNLLVHGREWILEGNRSPEDRAFMAMILDRMLAENVFPDTMTAGAVPIFDAGAFLQALPPRSLVNILQLPSFVPVLKALEDHLDWGPDVETEIIAPNESPAEEERPTGMAERTDESVAGLPAQRSDGTGLVGLSAMIRTKNGSAREAQTETGGHTESAETVGDGPVFPEHKGPPPLPKPS